MIDDSTNRVDNNFIKKLNKKGMLTKNNNKNEVRVLVLSAGYLELKADFTQT